MKNKVMILRVAQNDQSTLSHLYIDGIFACYLLEDTLRKRKIKTATAIPAGNYGLKLNTSGTMHARYKKLYPAIHQGMIEISGIPDYSGVFIHIGNSVHQTAGCPLTGSYWQQTSAGEYLVIQSRLAYEQVYPKLVGMSKTGTSIEVKNLKHLKIY